MLGQHVLGGPQIPEGTVSERAGRKLSEVSFIKVERQPFLAPPSPNELQDS